MKIQKGKQPKAKAPKIEEFPHEQGKCPKCGKYLEYGDSYPENEDYCYEWSCPTCNISGKEWYKMTFIEHTIN